MVLLLESRVEVIFVNASLDVFISISSSALSAIAILNFVFSPVSAKYVIDATSLAPPPGSACQRIPFPVPDPTDGCILPETNKSLL